MLSLRWPKLYKELAKKGTTPVWLHGVVMTLREESGEYEGEHQYAGHVKWHYADVVARVVSLSRLTPRGPDQPISTLRDIAMTFEPFPEGLRSGVEFRVGGRLGADGKLEPLTSSLEV